MNSRFSSRRFLFAIAGALLVLAGAGTFALLQSDSAGGFSESEAHLAESIGPRYDGDCEPGELEDSIICHEDGGSQFLIASYETEREMNQAFAAAKSTLEPVLDEPGSSTGTSLYVVDQCQAGGWYEGPSWVPATNAGGGDLACGVGSGGFGLVWTKVLDDPKMFTVGIMDQPGPDQPDEEAFSQMREILNPVDPDVIY